MLKENILETVTGKDWSYDPAKVNIRFYLPISKKKECGDCDNFIQKTNINEKNNFRFLDTDLGICVRSYPNIKVIAKNYKKELNCAFFKE